MRFLLDTNICIYIIKRQPPQVLDKFRTLDLSDVGIGTTRHSYWLDNFKLRRKLSKKPGFINQFSYNIKGDRSQLQHRLKFPPLL